MCEYAALILSTHGGSTGCLCFGTRTTMVVALRKLSVPSMIKAATGKAKSTESACMHTTRSFGFSLAQSQ